MITHSKLSNMKSEIIPNRFYGDGLGEFSNPSNFVLGAKRVNPDFICTYLQE